MFRAQLFNARKRAMPQEVKTILAASLFLRLLLERVAVRANQFIGNRLSGDDRVNRRVLREAS